MKRYRKPKRADKIALATIRILLTVGLLAIMAMVGYYAAVDGWESVLAWFTSRWACLIGVLILLAVTAGLWLWSFFKKMRELHDEE